MTLEIVLMEELNVVWFSTLLHTVDVKAYMGKPDRRRYMRTTTAPKIEAA